MKIFLLLCTALLSGCWLTIPATPDWPNAPDVKSCPDLALVADGTEKLSETLKVITTNYGEYIKCQGRVEAWSDWYKTQKQIYKDVK
jgi:hypothetical protein